MAALSAAAATRPMEPVRPLALSVARNARDRYWAGRSEWTTTSPVGWQRAIAERSAVTAGEAVMRSLIE
jgi:hypothetical protein